MAFLTAVRNTKRRDDASIEEHPVKGGSTIYAGGLVCLDAGWAVPGRSAVGLVTLGRAEHRATSVLDGDETVRIRRGVFSYANSPGADQIGRAAIGKPAFVVDDQTVALTDGGAARSVAGRVRDVDARGVWIEI